MERLDHQSTRARREERGIALIFCLFALILLSSIALGLIYMSDTETSINRNFRSAQQAFFGANAGIEEARSRMTPGMAGGITPLPTNLPGGANSVIYITNPMLKTTGLESIVPMDPSNPWWDPELCHENFPGLLDAGLANPGTGIPCAPVTPSSTGWWTYVDSTSPFTKTATALNFKWVRINLKINATNAPGFYVDGGANTTTYDKQVCWDGKAQVLKPSTYPACDAPPTIDLPIYKPVYVITSMAQGSRRITQAEVAQNPPIITNAAVDSQDHVTLNGQLGVNGYDYCSCVKKIDGSGNVYYDNRPGKICDRSRWGIYSASTVDNPNHSETIVAGQNPPIAENQPWNYDIADLVSTYKSSANVVDTRNAPYSFVCTGTPADCGTHSGQSFGVPPYFPPSPVDNPLGPANMAVQYTYVPGDLHITGNAQGNGVLIVDGDLDIDGGLQFYGLILVSGVVKFTGGGSQSTNIYGAVLAGQKSIDNTVLGGSANIFYDYCSLLDTRPPQPPTVISFREVMY